MIDADYAAINYVSGSHQLDRVLHKVVTFTVSARTETGVRLCLRVKCVRRKLCVQRLVSVRSIYRTGLVSMSTLAESPRRDCVKLRAQVLTCPGTPLYREKAHGTTAK